MPSSVTASRDTFPTGEGFDAAGARRRPTVEIFAIFLVSSLHKIERGAVGGDERDPRDVDAVTDRSL